MCVQTASCHHSVCVLRTDLGPLSPGLLLAPDHLRKDTDVRIKTIVQRDFAECIQQISLFPPGQAALRAEPAVEEALNTLVEQAWSEEAKDCARGALMQLTDRQQQKQYESVTEDTRHVMVSYQWSSQAIVKKIVAELQDREYCCWVDYEQMKGSLMCVSHTRRRIATYTYTIRVGLTRMLVVMIGMQ